MFLSSSLAVGASFVVLSCKTISSFQRRIVSLNLVFALELGFKLIFVDKKDLIFKSFARTVEYGTEKLAWHVGHTFNQHLSQDWLTSLTLI